MDAALNSRFTVSMERLNGDLAIEIKFLQEKAA
jgi:hypothetical protein